MSRSTGARANERVDHLMALGASGESAALNTSYQTETWRCRKRHPSGIIVRAERLLLIKQTGRLQGRAC